MLSTGAGVPVARPHGGWGQALITAVATWHTARMAGSAGSSPRFLQLSEVADILSISQAQVYALVRRGELRAIKIGGRGQWRVEARELEAFIERSYAETGDFIAAHPFGDEDELKDSDSA